MQFCEISKKDFNDWVKMGIALWPQYPEKETEEAFKQILKSRVQTAFLCKTDNNEPVAFINLSLRSDYVEGATMDPVGYIEGIYVKPAYREMGLARELVKLAEKWAVQHECKELGSDTEVANFQSQVFHKKTGFKEVETIVHFIKRLK